MAADRSGDERAARRERIGRVVGIGAGIVILLGAPVLIYAALTGGLSSTVADRKPVGRVPLPLRQVGDLDAAVEASGCTLTEPANEGRDHDGREFRIDDYEENPPTSGDHHPVAAEEGVYNRGRTPPIGQLVHALEHGRINLEYRTGSPKQLADQLESLAAETDGYHVLLYENRTAMEPLLVATAWDAKLTCDEVEPAIWDALRTFRDTYIDTAPEDVP